MSDLTFIATCATCPEWAGPERVSNLRSLADYDRHILTAAHTQHTTEVCHDCGHPTDGHDRRAEDGVCEACAPGEACNTRTVFSWQAI